MIRRQLQMSLRPSQLSQSQIRRQLQMSLRPSQLSQSQIRRQLQMRLLDLLTTSAPFGFQVALNLGYQVTNLTHLDSHLG